jgi:hypothetical protein
VNIQSKAQATKAKAFLLAVCEREGASKDIRDAVGLAFLKPETAWMYLDTASLTTYRQTMFDLTNGRSDGTKVLES